MAKLEQSVSEFLALKKRSEDALDFFMQKYGPIVFRHTEGICGDPNLAEESTAHAFNALWNNLDSINDEEHLLKWLRTTACNKCLSIIRSEDAKRRAEQAFLYTNDTSTPADITEVPPEKEEIKKANKVKRMWEAIKKLPRRQNMVISMRFIEGKEVEIIATELRIAEQTVRNHITKARRNLKKALAGLEFQ